jgi:hypothetical protein
MAHELRPGEEPELPDKNDGENLPSDYEYEYDTESPNTNLADEFSGPECKRCLSK